MQLDLSFQMLGAQRRFTSADLQRSADKNVLDEYREQYRVQLSGQDVGFMTFDIFHENELNLYEIVVDKQYRGRGIGTRMLDFAASLTREKDKGMLSVRPGPVREMSKDELIRFYENRGFRPSSAQEGLWIKKV